MSKKTNAREFALRRRKRRQWLTFMRMIRYGVNNFSRNAWLTIAATAVMTITLLIMFMTLAARNTLQTTVSSIRDKIDMSVYVQSDTKQEDVDAIIKDLKKLKTVKNVTFESPEQSRQAFAEQYSNDPNTLQALNQATNKFPGTLHVNLVDINNITELSNFTKTDKTYLAHKADREPSFAGPKRAAIKNIGLWINFADRAGLIASVVFIVISSLIVFNTIRMAIFNRKEEIQMMKLIGADRSFIRGPFIVEAIVYGFVAAILATSLGIGMLVAVQDKLLEYQVAIGPTISFLVSYIGFVLLGMIVVGALIGVISSLLATRRYLKI